MKFYIASRTARANDVSQIISTLHDKGHEVTYDWSQSGLEQDRPYSIEFAETEALKEIVAIKAADIFILLGDLGGTGMYVELGYALATGSKIYSIGEHNDITVFQYLTNVTRVDAFEDVLKDLEK